MIEIQFSDEKYYFWWIGLEKLSEYRMISLDCLLCIAFIIFLEVISNMTLEKFSSLPKKLSFNIPSYLDFLPPLKLSELTPTEQKLYLQLSLEFQIVLDNAPSFQMGAYKWNQVLDDRLQKYGLTTEEWERITNIGDTNDMIQEQLIELFEKLEMA